MNKKTMTLEQYNKKYRNRNEYLIKLKKSDADAYNRKFEHVVGNQYLFNGHKWQLIGDTYYQIPRPISFTWFRNLHAGVQVATCVLLGGVLVGGAATPIIINYVLNSVVVDSNEVTFSYSKDEEGNINANIKTKDNTYEIKEIIVKTKSYEFIKDQDYTYDFESGNILIKSESIKEHRGRIHIVPAVTAVQLVEIDCERTLVLDHNGQRSPSDLHVKYYPENAHDKKINDYDLDDNAPFYIDLNDGNKLKAKDGASGTAKLTLYAGEGNDILQTECYVTVKEEEEKPEDYLTITEIKTPAGEPTGKCAVSLTSGKSYPTHLIIPENDSKTGYPITNFDTNFAYADPKIETITLPQNLLQINPYAFQEWTSLKAINFNGTSNLTTIASNAFTNCTNLEWFKISNKLTTVAFAAFNGCTSLKFSLDGESDVFSISNDRTMLFNKDKTILYSMPQAKGVVDLTTYKSITQLYDGLFNTNTNLTGIKLPKSLTAINRYAFYGSGLKSAEFEDASRTWSIKNGETIIESAIDVNNPTTNATNLTKESWKEYNWSRN